MEEGFDVGQICINGHTINGSSIRMPEYNQAYCEKCGAKSITSCPACKTPIRGEYYCPGVITDDQYVAPKHCYKCGDAFPWTLKATNRTTSSTGTLTPNKVFISYVHENKELVDKICAALRRNSIEVWLDRLDIEPGVDWKIAIKSAILDGTLFVACFSKEWITKDTTYMNEELLIAIELLRKKQENSGWFIPLRLSPCKLPQYEIAPGKPLSDLQALDMYEDFDKGLERLIGTITRRIPSSIKTGVADDKSREEEASGRVLSYLACKALLDIGNGDYFHNRDMGHPVYVAGATGAIGDSWTYADSSDRNFLFKELSRLTNEIKALSTDCSQYRWWYDFSSWQSFCKYAVNIYRRKYGYEEL